MTKSNESLAIQRYLLLMHELAIRIDLTASACDGKLNLTPPYAREYCYLQFRRACELIALGCLQLHGELPAAQTQSAIKEWNAEKIMKLLLNEHPYSFPQSVDRNKTPEGIKCINANSKPNALTRDEFKKLYSECGSVLHRGTIRSLEAAGRITKDDLEKVVTWQRKIVDLMNEHLLVKPGRDSLYLVSLRTESGFPECSKLTPRGHRMDVQTFKLND